MYFIIKQEEKEDEEVEGFFGIWNVHKDAIYAFIFLFIGYVIAFSFWHIVLGDATLLNAQIETYCMINSPTNIEGCVQEYATGQILSPTGNAVGFGRFLSILENNIYVLIFTLIFSLIFGAGAIFILAWNATVIASAVGIFANYKLSELSYGLARYMFHGIPEITAYFIGALAGGMLGVGFIRHGIKHPKFYKVLQNVILLIFLAILVLIGSGLAEVYFTPVLYR
jgi:uncharacterized membrane protein SpoIIM required for sporulation